MALYLLLMGLDNMSNISKYTTKDASRLNKQTGPRPDTGYAVNYPDISANDFNNWNVRLIKPNKKYLNLWVENAQIDFSMSGSTGQSRWRREFYPHSFNEPTLILTGYAPNQREYNKIAAFVRESHSEALNVGRLAKVNTSEKTKGDKETPTVTLLMKSSNQDYKPRGQKGGRRGMKLEGYIASIAAGAQKFQQAPKFEIAFIVAASDGAVGIYNDTLTTGSKITDWMTLFKEDHFGAQSGTDIRKKVGYGAQTSDNQPEPEPEPLPAENFAGVETSGVGLLGKG